MESEPRTKPEYIEYFVLMNNFEKNLLKILRIKIIPIMILWVLNAETVSVQLNEIPQAI